MMSFPPTVIIDDAIMTLRMLSWQQGHHSNGPQESERSEDTIATSLRFLNRVDPRTHYQTIIWQLPFEAS